MFRLHTHGNPGRAAEDRFPGPTPKNFRHERGGDMEGAVHTVSPDVTTAAGWGTDQTLLREDITVLTLWMRKPTQRGQATCPGSQRNSATPANLGNLAAHSDVRGAFCSVALQGQQNTSASLV